MNDLIADRLKAEVEELKRESFLIWKNEQALDILAIMGIMLNLDKGLDRNVMVNKEFFDALMHRTIDLNKFSGSFNFIVSSYITDLEIR